MRTLLFRIDKTSLGVSRIGVATPRDDCPYTKSNANTFVRARAYRVFRLRELGSTSGAPLVAFGTLGVPPRLIPPHSVGKPYTNSPPSSIVTLLFRIDKSSRGVSRIDEATPWDACPYA